MPLPYSGTPPALLRSVWEEAKPSCQEAASPGTGSAYGEPPHCFGSTPAQDSLLFSMLHGEGSHSPNITQGLIRYARCPGYLQRFQEIGNQVGDEEE